MKTKKKKLLAEDFTYPTKEERILAGKDYPKLVNFGFNYISALKSVLVDKMKLPSRQ